MHILLLVFTKVHTLASLPGINSVTVDCFIKGISVIPQMSSVSLKMFDWSETSVETLCFQRLKLVAYCRTSVRLLCLMNSQGCEKGEQSGKSGKSCGEKCFLKGHILKWETKEDATPDCSCDVCITLVE